MFASSETLEHHYPIKITLLKSTKVFLAYYLSFLKGFFKNTETDKLYQMFTKGEDHLSKDFKIEKIVKNIRNFKIALK